MNYTFKLTPELIWAALTVIGGALATAIATQGATPPTDWRAWAIGLGAALVRALLGLLLGAATGGVQAK